MYSGFTESEQAAFDAAIVGQVREFRHRVKFGYWSGTPRRFNAQLTMEDGIRSISINQMVNADSSMLTMGCACSSMLKLEFYKPETSLNLSNKVIKIECGLKCGNSYLYVPMGCYNIDEFTSEDDFRTIQIVAYDDMQKLSEAWETSLTYPQTAKQVIAEIASAHQFSVEYSTFAGTALNRIITHADAEKLLSYSTREVLGILAGIAGGNVFFTQSGALRFGWYDESNVDVPLTLQWQGGLKKTQSEPFTIQSVTSGVDDAVYTAGTGKGISFVNPIITHAEIDAIQESVEATEFLPCEVNWRGNPCIGCGDAVTVYDKSENGYTVFITEQEIDLTGGLSQRIVCPSADGELSFSTTDTETQRSISRVRTDLQNAIATATARIIGANGGYITPIDTDGDGTLDTLIISETPVDLEHPENTNGEVIRINRAGIGLSSTGYNGPFVTAVTGAGINANAITAGSISADMLTIGTAAKVKNLILDGGFTGGGGWHANYWDVIGCENNGTIYPFDGITFTGEGTLLLDIAANKPSGAYIVNHKKNIPVKSNTRYAFGFSVQFTGESGVYTAPLDMAIRHYDSNGNFIQGSKTGLPGGAKKPETAVDWYRYNAAFTSTSNTAYVTIELSIQHETGKWNHFSFDSVMLFETDEVYYQYNTSDNTYSADPDFPFDDLLNPPSGNVSVTGKGIDIYQGAFNIYDSNGVKRLYSGSDGWLNTEGLTIRNGDFKMLSPNGQEVVTFDNEGNCLIGGENPFRINWSNDGSVYSSGTTKSKLLTKEARNTTYSDSGTSILKMADGVNEYLPNLRFDMNVTSANPAQMTYGSPYTLMNAFGFHAGRQDDSSTYVAIANDEIVVCGGEITAEAINAWSDETLKTNISPAGSMLDKIVAAGIYNYDYVSEVPETPVIGTQSEDYTPPTPQHYGLVIGDGYNTPEEVVSKDGKGIDLYSMISIAWKAIQEQQAQIAALEQRISVLEGSNDAN